MPVILTKPEEIEAWLTAPAEEALKLQRPLPDGLLKIVGRARKRMRRRRHDAEISIIAMLFVWNLLGSCRSYRRFRTFASLMAIRSRWATPSVSVGRFRCAGDRERAQCAAERSLARGRRRGSRRNRSWRTARSRRVACYCRAGAAKHGAGPAMNGRHLCLQLLHKGARASLRSTLANGVRAGRGGAAEPG